MNGSRILSGQGRNPDDVDIDEMWLTIRSTRKPGTAATKLGLSVEHVRLAAIRNPDDYAGASRTGYNAKIRRAGLADPEEVRRRYRQGTTLAQMAASLGCSQTTLSNIARQYGVVTRNGSPPKFNIDPDWVRDQYEVQRRTLDELAAELGMSAQRLGSRANEFGIKTRGRGGASHRHPLARHGGPGAFSSTMWKVLSGTGSELRIRRFLAAIGSHSVRNAASELGIHEATLYSYIKRLESDTRLQLLTRAGGRIQLTLTPDGRRFVAEVQTILTMLADADLSSAS